MGPLVFDIRDKRDRKDFPIRVYDHDFDGDLEGLTDIIFSSFTKLLECLTFVLIENKSQKLFDILPHFFQIDPNGAGSSGKSYWLEVIDMHGANFEEFGY